MTKKQDIKWNLPERPYAPESEILRLYERCMDDNDGDTTNGNMQYKRDNNCARCRRNFGPSWVEADKFLRSHYKNWFIRLCALCSSDLIECDLCETLMKPHEAIINRSGVTKCPSWISHPHECVCCDAKPASNYLWSFEGRRDLSVCHKCLWGSWLCHKCKCIRSQGPESRPRGSCEHCNARKTIYIRDNEDVWDIA